MKEPIKILLIEDSIADADLFEEALKNSEIKSELAVVRDPMNGLYLLQNSFFDCVFLNCLIPKMNGMEIIKKAREIGIQVPLIMLNVHGDEPFAVEAIKYGAFDYISNKRPTAEVIFQSIRNAINSFKALQSIKKIEAELEQEKKKFQLFIGTSKVFYLELDKQAHVVFVNEEACDILGHPKDFILGKNWFDYFLPKRDNMILKDLYFKDIKNLKIVAEYYEGPILNASGDERLIAWHKVILTDDNGNFSSNIYCGENITEKKTIESEPKNSYQKMDNFYDNSLSGYHSLNENMEFIQINKTELKWLGYEENELMDSFKITNILAPSFKEIFHQHFENLKLNGYVKDFEVDFLCKDASILNLIINSIAVYDTNGKFIESRNFVFDNTGLNNAQLKLIEAVDLTNESLKVKDKFLANINHEIRTPLNGIIGITEILLETKLSDEQNLYLNSLKQSTNVLMGIINDILDISKIESGSMPLESNNVNLKQVLRDSVMAFYPSAIEKSIALNIQIDDWIPENVIGDSSRLIQIISNLLSNALKFTNKGEVKVQVDVLSIIKDIVDIQFKISDTGIGIPDDKKEIIFEIFTQASMEKSRKYGGIGLGLSLVKNLVQMMKGEISLNSIMNKGSVFTFNIPFGKYKSIEVSNNYFNDFKQKYDFKGLRILIVEDNFINQMVASSLLNNKNANTLVVSSGPDALNLIKSKDFDLVLMDIQMPEMDGYETSRLMRAEGLKIPIFVLTAYTTGMDSVFLNDSGINDFISKPFKPYELYVKLLSYFQDLFTFDEESKLANLDFLDELSDGNMEFKKQMIISFINQTKNLPEALIEFLKNNEWNKISAISHKLKPGLAYMGIPILSTTLDNIERNAKFAKDEERLISDVVFFGKIYEKAKLELETYITEMAKSFN